MEVQKSMTAVQRSIHAQNGVYTRNTCIM